ncbi:sensor histidine kinase [Pedobacter aquatilis]|uniref:sensor histidine kinase n=1 Tax=Pedobacter aquatilis TaxID=351343 RepID=UPI00292CD693|nr:histidine kinase [Pedobacter aquatilis]
MALKLKISLYWKCQLIGWSCAALYWGFNGFIGGNFNWSVGLLQFVTDVGIYILLTHLYRNFALARGWNKLPLKALLLRLIFTVVVMGFAYFIITLVKTWLFRTYFFTGNGSFKAFVDYNGLNILIAGIRLMSIWLLAYHLYHYAIREIIIAKENANLLVLQKEARLNHLSAQLNPHFLFNAMNTIKSLITENPLSARRGIDLLSDLLRSGLYSGEDFMVSLEREINLIADYLEMEKLRFEERLEYDIQIDNKLGDLNAIIIPKLSIQTLVENALKHGISKLKAGGLISISITRRDESLLTLVSNPGSIKTNKLSQGLGLKNLNERIRLTYKEKACLKVTEEHAKVLATLILPL